MQKTERAGGCVCRAIRYVTVGEPERVTLCHCTWCQRRTGTAFGAEVVFRKENVVLSGIEPSRYRHVSDESGVTGEGFSSLRLHGPFWGPAGAPMRSPACAPGVRRRSGVRGGAGCRAMRQR